jgi:transcriptional regulator with XRE-family HTH domain
MSNTNSIGSFLAALRKANGLTQKQLAEKLNVSDKAVSRWERDECAPDLSLIPVIAEIFGITSDELLRGQRAAPDTVPSPQTEEKSKKRLQYLLKQIQTRYKIQSLISVGTAVLGVIAAMILNAFNRAQAGFLVGCIFFLAATVCQVIFLMVEKSHLNEEDFDEAAVTACRRDIIKGAEWVFGIISILTFATAPLMLADDPFWGLTVPYFWTNGLASALIPAIITPIVCFIINGRLGVRKPLPQKAKQRLTVGLILLPILLVTMYAQSIFADYLQSEPQILYEGTKCETFEEFKEIIETPLDPNGVPLEFISEDGRVRYYRDNEGTKYRAFLWDHEWKLGVPGEPYWEANHTIYDVNYDGDNWYLYDIQQHATMRTRYWIANAIFAILYPAEISVAILIYHRKSRVTQK